MTGSLIIPARLLWKIAKCACKFYTKINFKVVFSFMGPSPLIALAMVPPTFKSLLPLCAQCTTSKVLALSCDTDICIACPQFNFVAPIVFGRPDPENSVFQLTSLVTFKNLISTELRCYKLARQNNCTHNSPMTVS